MLFLPGLRRDSFYRIRKRDPNQVRRAPEHPAQMAANDMSVTREQLLDRWKKRAQQYEQLSNKAELGDFNDDEIDPAVHYRVIADMARLCATELSHLQDER